MAPLAGWLIDRYGPRRMLFLGLGMMGLGFLALSRINSLMMLYVVYLVLLAGGSSLGGLRPAQVSVANWFIRRRGRAMGILVTGFTLGGSLVAVLAMAIEALGWRAAATIAGLAILIVGIPLASVIRHKPEQMGLLPDGDQVPLGQKPLGSSVAPTEGAEVLASQQESGKNPGPEGGAQKEPTAKETLKARHFWMSDPRPEIDLTVWQALRTPAFWLMTLGWTAWAAVPILHSVYLGPFLVDELKVEYLPAMGAVSMFAIIATFGRVGFGFLADYVNIRLLAILLLAMEGIGVFLFSHVQTMAQVPFYLVIWALAHGGMLPTQNVLQGYLFGRKRFGTIGGLLQFTYLPVTVAAPILVGWMADTLPGGFRLAYRSIAIALMVGAVFVLAIRRPRNPLPADRPPALFQLLRRRREVP